MMQFKFLGFKCKEYGKQVQTIYSLDRWAWKLDGHKNFCSYNCMRKYQWLHPTRQNRESKKEFEARREKERKIYGYLYQA